MRILVGLGVSLLFSMAVHISVSLTISCARKSNIMRCIASLIYTLHLRLFDSSMPTGSHCVNFYKSASAPVDEGCVELFLASCRNGATAFLDIRVWILLINLYCVLGVY